MTLTEHVDHLFSEWNKTDTPGCAIAIIQNGKVIYTRGYGMADLEHSIPISANSVFDIGSISKQFVAMSIVLLEKQARISLDDEIQKYLPEIKRYEHPITIRHLIHHTSGLRDYLALMDMAGWPFEFDYCEEEIIDLIARQKELNFQPGEEFLYCNSGYFLLGEIVKRVSGFSLREFANKNIFTPLGMQNTHFHDDFTEIVKNRAAGYSPNEDHGFKIDMSLFDAVGDGGVYTTVEDLCLWDENFYHNIIGGYGQDLIEEITTPGKLNSGEGLDYAFGLLVSSYRGLKTISHGGVWMGYRAGMIRFPEQRFSVICLSNLSSIIPTQLVRQISDIYLAEEFTKPEEKTIHTEQQSLELSKSEMEDKTGFYRDIRSGTIWELTAQEGKLMVEVTGESFQIIPTSPNCFKSVGFPLVIYIEFEKHGPPGLPMMKVQMEGSKPDCLERVNAIPLESCQLADYAGDYYSDELGTQYRLLLENGALSVSRENSPREHLKQVSRDLFTRRRTYEFIRNEQNRVVGFNLQAGRVKNIQFLIRL